jgi:hypothetical protein
LSIQLYLITSTFALTYRHYTPLIRTPQ